MRLQKENTVQVESNTHGKAASSSLSYIFGETNQYYIELEIVTYRGYSGLICSTMRFDPNTVMQKKTIKTETSILWILNIFINLNDLWYTGWLH